MNDAREAPKNRSEVAIVVILRVMGISGLFAIPAIFFPYSWMNAIHQHLGLGELPDVPIVSYLARSLSGFYAVLATIILFVSFDIRRYRSFLKLWAVLLIVIGITLFGIDLAAGLPIGWTLSEGPLLLVVGVTVLWLQPRITRQSNGIG